MSMKRTYNSEKRQAQAEKTKSRLLAAAKKLFEVKGFDVVTIEEIALCAKVSVATVYSLFQSKRGILRALLDEALIPEFFDTLVQRVKREKSPQKRLALSAKIARTLYDAEKTQIDLFRGASVVDPECRALEEEKEQRRYLRQDETVQRLAQEGVLKKGLTVYQAKDILWAFTGRDLYRMLVRERGWSSDAYEKWLAQVLIETILM